MVLSQSYKKIQKTLENNTILAIGVFLLLLISVMVPNQANAYAPTVSTNPVTIVSASRVTLNGFINPNDLNTSYWFELNENGSINSFGNGNLTSAGNVQVSLIEMDPTITYSVRLVAQNSDGKSYGETISFSTNQGSSQTTNNTSNYQYNNAGNNNNSGANAFGNTPIVNTTYATNVTDNGAIFNGYVDPNGGSNVYRWFEWGTTQALGNVSGNLSAGTYPNYFSHGISGLERNTTYYYRAGAHSSAGTVNGSIFSFTTGTSNTNTSNIAPIVLAKTPSYIGADRAQLNATAVKGGSSLKNAYFEWGTSQALGNTTPTQMLTQESSVNIIETLSTLKPDTAYSYRVVVQDAKNAVYRSRIVTFYTSRISNGIAPASIQNGSQTPKSSAKIEQGTIVKQPGKTTDTTEKNVSSGAAGAFFAKTSIALLGWFLSIILLMIVIIMGVMLKKGKKNDTTGFETEGFKEFPNIPGHPTNNIK